MIKKVVCVLPFCFWVGTLFSQQSTTSSGGVATGVGGVVTYSVGVVAYQSNESSAGSVSAGVQQVYEITNDPTSIETQMSLEMSAYPYPIQDVLTLSIGDHSVDGLKYQLCDGKGSIVQSQVISVKNTSVDLSGNAKGIYFLKVVSDNQVIQSFKILKK